MKFMYLIFFLFSLESSFLHAAAFAKKRPRIAHTDPAPYVTVACSQSHATSFKLTKKNLLGVFIYSPDNSISGEQLQYPLEYLLHEISVDRLKFKGSSITGGDLFVQSDTRAVQVALGIKLSKRDLLLTFWVMHLYKDSGSFSCSSKGRMSYAVTGKNPRSSRIVMPARSKLDVYRISASDTGAIFCSLKYPLESTALMNLHAPQDDHVDQLKDLQSPYVLIHFAKLLAVLK